MLTVCPVVHSQNALPWHAHLPYNIYKELKKSLTEYWMQSSYSGHIGWNWGRIWGDYPSSMHCLGSGVSRFGFIQSINNLNNNVPINSEQLLREGDYSSWSTNCLSLKGGYVQISDIVQKAWKRSLMLKTLPLCFLHSIMGWLRAICPLWAG